MKKIINIILVILIAFNIGISFNRGMEKENIIYKNDYMGANKVEENKDFNYQKDDSSFNELEMNSTDVLLEEVKTSKIAADNGSTESIPDTGIDFDILGFIIPGILIVLIAICSEVDDAYIILNRIIKK